MGIDAKTLIQKADLAVSDLISDGGYLNPEQFNKFFRKVMEGPTSLIKEIRTVTMKSPQMEIDKIGFGSRMLRPAPTAGSTLADADRYAPSLEKVELNVKKLWGEIFLPYDVLEDNIERGTLQDTIISMAAQRVNVDLSELIILGDTTVSDPYLALLDGVLKQAQHQIDASSTITSVSLDMFKEALKNMPSKYLTNRAMMRYWISTANETEYRSSLASRATALGDKMITDTTIPFAFGIKIDPEYHVPNNKVLLTYPQNVILGFHRKVTFRLQEEPRRDGVFVVISLRVDVKLEEPDACVVLTTGIS